MPSFSEVRNLGPAPAQIGSWSASCCRGQWIHRATGLQGWSGCLDPGRRRQALPARMTTIFRGCGFLADDMAARLIYAAAA